MRKFPEGYSGIRLRWRLEGKCTECGGEIEGDLKNRRTGTKKVMCRACLKKNSKKLAKYRKNRHVRGLCERCGKRRPKKNRRNCQICTEYLRNKARQYDDRTFFAKRTRSGDLRYSIGLAKTLCSLWKEQRGKCVLTGRRLDRYNAEVDHVVPLSKGGLNTRSNLRWLHKDVNQAKRSLSDVEFIRLCKDVIEHIEKAAPSGTL